ncbi:MAG TPA: TIGR03088 family PEP-CTERM/XrtA system glycosyltransferase [Burkholderiaceae bacterium]|nr:TIGR03088 family PEP-CTERM/XrtA system glycosyltransferase [Burkholderiaceae bacterium]
MATDARPLVMHLVYRFDTGGLENGVVNLINHLPVDEFRHMVVALTDVSATFRARVRAPGAEFVALGKGPGHLFAQYPRLFALMRHRRPAIVHTRNLAALEAVVPAWAAGVPVRIHGEHGRDVGDLDGSNVKLQRVRRLYRPFVSHYVALSRDLDHYLRERVGVPAPRVTQLYNGVDTAAFRPAMAGESMTDSPFERGRHWVIGTVGRMQTVKNQPALVDAFIALLQAHPALRGRARLVLVGDGPLRAACEARLAAAGLRELAWLPGERSDVPALMRTFDAFALPSLAEGISNTVLEAMACALPVVATDVGGNADLVRDGETGFIVPAADTSALAGALARLATAPAQAAAMGRAGRALVQQRFSLQSMVDQYRDLYVRHLQRAYPQLRGA